MNQKKFQIKFKIFTLGCKVNQCDSGKLKKILQEKGFIFSQNNPDIIIINTCSVTASAIIKDQRALRSARKDNPGAKIILAGCWPQNVGINQLAGQADLVWGVGRIDDLADSIRGFFRDKQGKCNIPATVSSVERSRYFAKVQDGCEQFCSYCVIPYVRGKLKSRGSQEIISEIGQAVSSGFEEIVICGIHLGLYGKEPGFDEKNGLVGLIKKILLIRGLKRLRLSSIEATEVDHDLIELMASEARLCRHLHLPLQSGNDRILKLMNRPYDTAYFAKKIQDLRQSMPDIAVSTDIIVGFPGETEAEFEETCEFAQKIGFSRLHVFPFSAHPRVLAAKMPGHIPGQAIAQRAKKLRRLGAALEDRFKQKFAGQELELLVEAKREGLYRGRSQYYCDYYFKKSDIADWMGHDERGLIRKIVRVSV